MLMEGPASWELNFRAVEAGGGEGSLRFMHVERDLVSSGVFLFGGVILSSFV